jgi:hypothetical protein
MKQRNNVLATMGEKRVMVGKTEGMRPLGRTRLGERII